MAKSTMVIDPPLEATVLLTIYKCIREQELAEKNSLPTHYNTEKERQCKFGKNGCSLFQRRLFVGFVHSL